MKNRNAFTLVEILVSILISALVAMASFSIFTSSVTAHKKSDKKELAGLAIKMVQEELKNYVTSDTSNAVISGPNVSWRLCNHLGICDNFSGWALQQGNHTITNFLNTEPFLSKLCDGNVANCSFTYTVTDINCGFGTGVNACKRVQFTLNYPN